MILSSNTLSTKVEGVLFYIRQIEKGLWYTCMKIIGYNRALSARRSDPMPHGMPKYSGCDTFRINFTLILKFLP